MAARERGQFSGGSARADYPGMVTRTPRYMLATAALCAVAFVVVTALAYFFGPAQYVDDAALHGFVSLYRPSIAGIAKALAHLCNPFPYALVAVALIAVGLRSKGPRVAAAATLLLAGANVS